MFDHFKLIVIAFELFAFLWLLSYVKGGTRKKQGEAGRAEANKRSYRDDPAEDEREDADDLDEFEDE